MNTNVCHIHHKHFYMAGKVTVIHQCYLWSAVFILERLRTAAVAVPLTLVVTSLLACRNICIISRAGKNVDFYLRIEYAMHIQLVDILHCGT